MVITTVGGKYFAKYKPERADTVAYDGSTVNKLTQVNENP